MNLKSKKGLLRLSILAIVLLSSIFLLTGCIRGAAPVGWSGIVVSDGTLYTGSKEGRLVSVNTTNNNALQLAEPLRVSSSGGGSCVSTGGGACGGAAPAIAIYGTPALATVPVLGNLVYIAGYNGKVFAYDAATLQQRWVYPVDANLEPIFSSIAISDKMLYFGCKDDNVYALATDTGAFKWKFATGGEIWGSPVVDNGVLFVGSFDKKVYAIDANTGKEKWDFPTEANVVSTPVAVNGVIYVGSLDRNLYAIDENNGKQIWKFTGDNWFWTRPVVVNGVIYAPNLDNKVYGLDIKTGNNITTWDVGGQVASWPVVVNNQVVVATENGKLFSLDTASPRSAPRLVATTVEEVTAPLANINDVVYINGPDNNLYAYNITTGAKFTTVSLKSQ